MSTDELEKYNSVYSRFLQEMVDMHNAHLLFINNRGRGTVFAVRRHHKQIMKTQHELYRLTGKVYAEHRANTKEKFSNMREARKKKEELKQIKIQEGKIKNK